MSGLENHITLLTKFRLVFQNNVLQHNLVWKVTFYGAFFYVNPKRQIYLKFIFCSLFAMIIKNTWLFWKVTSHVYSAEQQYIAMYCCKKN